MGFAEKPLQRPPAACLNLDRHSRKRHYPAEIGGSISLERKAGEIALDTIMPRDQCRRTSKLHISVWGQQSPTRKSRKSLECKHSQRNHNSGNHLFKHQNHSRLSFSLPHSSLIGSSSTMTLLLMRKFPLPTILPS